MALLDDHPSIQHRAPADTVLQPHLEEGEQLRWAAYQQYTARWWHPSANEFIQVLGTVLLVSFILFPSLDDQDFYLIPIAIALVLMVSLSTILYRGYRRFSHQKYTVYGLTTQHLIRLRPEQSAPTRWVLSEIPPLLAFARINGTFDAYYTEKVVDENGSGLTKRMLVENAEGDRQVVQLLLSVQRQAQEKAPQ